MNSVLTFLKLVTQRFPPIARRDHSISLDGNRLALTLFTSSPAPVFFLSDQDLVRSPGELLEELEKLVDEPQPVEPPPSNGPISAA